MSAIRRISTTKLLFTAIVLLFAAAFAYPAFLTVITSLKTQDEVISNPLALPHHVTFSAYTETWNILGFGHLLLNSLIYAGVGAALALLLGIYPAYAFSRFRLPGGRIIFFLLLTTLMMPQQTALIPLYHFLSLAGLLNTRLGLVIVHAAWGMPLQVLLLTGFFANQPRELEEAARMDGATDLQLLRHVMVPLALPALAVGFVLNFVGIWKEFIFAVTFLTAQSVYPLTVGLLNVSISQYFSSYTLPAAAVVISMLPLIALFILAHRWLTRGIYAGAVK
jgi:raffinose/stachyose/melibiose transport system permease protein